MFDNVKKINHFKGSKQNDKIHFNFRIGKFTLFELYYDDSSMKFRVIFFNLGYQN